MSTTETLNDFESLLPWASEAVQLTVVLRSRANCVPEAGVQLRSTLPSTRSVACADHETRAPAGLVASAVMSSGTVMAGAVVSRTVTVNVADPVLPRVSSAVHVTVVSPTG